MWLEFLNNVMIFNVLFIQFVFKFTVPIWDAVTRGEAVCAFLPLSSSQIYY